MTDHTPDASELSAQALTAARAAKGSAEDVARLHARLQVALAAPPAAAVPVEARASIWSNKLTWLGVVAAIGAGSLMRIGTPAERPAAPRALPAVTVPVASPAQPLPAPTPRVEAELAPGARALPLPPPGTGSAGGRAVKARPVRRPLPAAALPPPPTAAEFDGRGEIPLIMQAQDLLARQPARALELLAQHRAEFPRGVLVEERESLAFDAELALGRKADAATRARAFTTHFPDSPHARRMQAWLKANTDSKHDHKPASSPVLTD